MVAGYMLLTGVPIPDQTRATCVDTPLILALAALVIGECLVEAGEARSVRNRIAGLARRNPKLKGRKFDMRKIGGGVQVWRIA